MLNDCMCIIILITIVIYLIYRYIVVKEEHYQQKTKDGLPDLDNSKLIDKDNKMFYCQFDENAGVYWQEPGPDGSDLDSNWQYSGCDGYSKWGLNTDKTPKKCLNKKNKEINYNTESLFNDTNKELLTEINDKEIGQYQLSTNKDELDDISNKIKNFTHNKIHSDDDYCKTFAISNWKNDINEFKKLKDMKNRSSDDDTNLFALHNKIQKKKTHAFNKCKAHVNKKYLFDRFNNKRVNKKCLREQKCDPSHVPHN